MSNSTFEGDNVNIHINIDNEEDDVIFKEIRKSVKRIIDFLEKKKDAVYDDTTYREIYIRCQQFSKDLTDILVSANMNKPTI